MAFKKDYYERKQVKHRQKYGKLEKRKELIERLKKIKERKKEIIDAKNEIETVTDKEIVRAENKIKSFQNIPTGKKFKFDEEGNKILVQRENLTHINENLSKYNDYLEKLILTRKKISEQL
ncbi:hypothetical protein NAPIS_ORF02054 [Vairimorpha apis BRL 01]|uniref:Uncharacterized protein n=1 Tax=Vairimorpha apis BRL 01 TaxID=1037528 RepID=T0KYF3_9MICR|nr:hypothetical protein NAPIS_ORF02054 [Vairimorpha apis BRL 01]